VRTACCRRDFGIPAPVSAGTTQSPSAGDRASPENLSCARGPCQPSSSKRACRFAPSGTARSTRPTIMHPLLFVLGLVLLLGSVDSAAAAAFRVSTCAADRAAGGGAAGGRCGRKPTPGAAFRPSRRFLPPRPPCGSPSSSAAPDPTGDSKPFFAAVGDGKEEGGSSNSSSSSSSAPTNHKWSALTVAQLREVLKVRGLPSSGIKAALVERLQTHEARVCEAVDSSAAGTEKTAGSPVPTTTSRRPGRRSGRAAVPVRAPPKSRGRLPADGAKGTLAARLSGGETGEKEGGGGVAAMAAAPYGGMTVAALQAVLRQRRLPVSGTKARLLSRLEASDAASNSGSGGSV
jgi:SAP domain